MNLEKRIISPHLLRQLKIKKEEDVTKRSIISRKNTSIFYSYLYKELFGGKIAKINALKKYKLLNDQTIIFSPDIIKNTKQGREYTEIKVTSHRSASPLCATLQFSNYAYFLLKRIEKKDQNPNINYAIFRYGKRENSHLDALTNGRLIQRLSQSTRDLLILPLNLLILLLNTSFRDNKNQESSQFEGNRDYWRPGGKDISSLHKDITSINHLLERLVIESHNETLREYLDLDQIYAEKYMAPNNLVCRNYGIYYDILPFTITYYKNKDTKWLKNFEKYHPKILNDFLNVRNLYQEEKEVPF